MEALIKLGYEVGTGTPIGMPIRNTCVIGQTQEAGKTTALEAMASRSGKTAIAFVTKRFESRFGDAHKIAPYFRERADWQFVAAILEATLREKMKFQRSWIMKLCTRNGRHWAAPKTLVDVADNVQMALLTAKGINESVYTELKNYLELVIPQLAGLAHSCTGWDRNRLSVINVSEFSTEVQSLIIHSVLTEVYKENEGVISIIPEAWEFIPQKRNSPVKLAAIDLVRKGSAGKNYVWLDSQDIGGVDKEILRSCPVWLLGVQRERLEVKRNLEQMPFSGRKPKVEDIMGLTLGQFFLCYGTAMKKVYVQPAMMSDITANQIALGRFKADKWTSNKGVTTDLGEVAKVRERYGHLRSDVQMDPHHITIARQKDEAMWKEKYDSLSEEFAALQRKYVQLENRIENTKLIYEQAQRKKPVENIGSVSPLGDLDGIYQYVRNRIREDPVLLSLAITKPMIEVLYTEEKISLDTSTLRGKIAKMAATEGLLDSPMTGHAVFLELKDRRRIQVAKPNVYKELDKLCEQGFLRKEESGYQRIAEVTVKEAR